MEKGKAGCDNKKGNTNDHKMGNMISKGDTCPLLPWMKASEAAQNNRAPL